MFETVARDSEGSIAFNVVKAFSMHFSISMNVDIVRATRLWNGRQEFINEDGDGHNTDVACFI